MHDENLMDLVTDIEYLLERLRDGASEGGNRSTPQPDGHHQRPAIDIRSGGKVAVGRNGLQIEYRGKDSCPYGKSATRNRKAFEAIVVHHTGRSHSTDWYVQYQIDGDPGRGGHHFGYHFYIAPDGDIIQGAPLTKRTNHVRGSNANVRVNFGRHANNTNAIGITCARAGYRSRGFSPTAAQIRSLEALTIALCDQFDIDFSQIYGHGDIQTDRRSLKEGQSAARKMRGWASSGGPDLAFVPVFSSSEDLDDDSDLDDSAVDARTTSSDVDLYDGPLDVNEFMDAPGTDDPPSWAEAEFEGYDPGSTSALLEDHDDLTEGAEVWHSETGGGHQPLGAGHARLRYINHNSIRNRQVTPNIERLLKQSVKAVYGSGCRVDIYSGGQDRLGHGNRRTGSIRHDDYGQGGRAADVYVYDANGRQIIGLKLARLGQYWLASRFGGVGHEMRNGGIHLDEWTTPPPGGGMFWTYSASNSQSWGARARRMLADGARGIFP